MAAMTPLILPTGYILPDTGLFAVGVEGERRAYASGHLRLGEFYPPSWAVELADERCQTCGGTGEVTLTPYPNSINAKPMVCGHCIDGHPLRPVRVKCGNCAGHGEISNDRIGGGWSDECPACDGHGYRTVGEAAVLACVPVIVEDVIMNSTAPIPAWHLILRPYTGETWIGGPPEFGIHRIHFPNASDYQWALVARIKENR